MATSSSAGSSPASQNGGTVEPMKPPTGAKARSQAQRGESGERYELRDPFVDVTYRSRSLEEILAKAEELGSARFVAIAQDGRRTPVVQTGGEWQRGKQLAARSERPLDTTQDEPSVATARSRTTPGSSQTQAHHASTTVDLPGPLGAPPSAEAHMDRAAHIAKLEAELQERYIIKKAPATIGPILMGQTEYRFRGDTSRIAFTESSFRLATDTNSPSVARSMVDVALARNWQGLRVSGSEDFRRLIWLEASVRGIKALGYEPNPADLDVLKREREARQTNRVERLAQAGPQPAATSTEKVSSRGGGGRKAVVAAIDAILRGRGVPASKREAVLTAANEQLARRAREGQMPKVRVFDPAAPTKRPAPTPSREASRSRERAAPAQVR